MHHVARDVAVVAQLDPVADGVAVSDSDARTLEEFLARFEPLAPVGETDSRPQRAQRAA